MVTAAPVGRFDRIFGFSGDAFDPLKKAFARRCQRDAVRFPLKHSLTDLIFMLFNLSEDL